MLDDNVGINANAIKIQHNGENMSFNTDKSSLFKVNMDDNVYDMLKDKRIDDVNKCLSEKLSSYATEHNNIGKNNISKRNSESDSGSDIDKMDKIDRIDGIKLKQISNSVNNIKILNNEYPLKLLKTHFKITQSMIEKFNDNDNLDILDLEQELLNKYNKKRNYISIFLNMINDKKYTLERIIRLICLYCIVNDGIDNDSYCTLNKHILINFGNGGKHYNFLLENLLKCGILYPKNAQYSGLWKNIKKELQLLVDYDTNNPKDIAYVFGGYAPISCRIIEHALLTGLNTLIQQKTKNKLFRGWRNKNVDDKLFKIGTNFHVVQDCDIDKLTKEQYINMDSIVLIYFIGGITYSEISALRFLATMNTNKRILIVTTKIINSNNFIKTLV